MDAMHSEPAYPLGVRDAVRYRILIVDDDEVFTALCRRFLNVAGSQVEFDTLAARDAAEAAAYYAAGDIDCVLVDYALPDTTGTRLMRTLQPDYDPCVPMIMLTAMSCEDVVIESVHAGVADFLSKDGLTSGALRRAIRNAIEKAQLHRSLAQRNMELETANSELSQRNEEIRRFYHTVSHEIKTPLTAVREFVALVLDEVPGKLNEEQKELLGYATQSCDDIKKQFDDLIDSTRSEVGKLVLRLHRTSIEDCVQRSLMSVRASAESKGVILGSQLGDIAVPLDLDQGRICQVLTNVLTNAIKFTSQGGLVTLSAYVTQGSTPCIAIDISDTGCGIPAEHIPHIFDRLYQVDGDDDACVRDGLGLGLSIARDIVQLHNGSINVCSKPGVGTTVEIRLPVAADGDGNFG